MDNFNPAVISPFFQVSRFSINPAAISGYALLCPADSARVLIAFSCQSAYEIRVGGQQAAFSGLLIPSAAAPFVMKFSDWGGAVGGEIWTPFEGAGSVITAICVRYQPTG